MSGVAKVGRVDREHDGCRVLDGRHPISGGAAMAGIIMFSRTLSMEVKRSGIRVNVITPSVIEGTATHANVMADEFTSKLFGKATKMAQLGVVNAADMAALILFLASPQASKISGQAISCNGGISAA